MEHIFHPQGLHLEAQFIILGSQQHSALWIQKLLTVHFHCSVFAFLGSNPVGSWQADDSGSAPSAKDIGKDFYQQKITIKLNYTMTLLGQTDTFGWKHKSNCHKTHQKSRHFSYHFQVIQHSCQLQGSQNNPSLEKQPLDVYLSDT